MRYRTGKYIKKESEFYDKIHYTYLNNKIFSIVINSKLYVIEKQLTNLQNMHSNSPIQYLSFISSVLLISNNPQHALFITITEKFDVNEFILPLAYTA